jgi:hypothetical protein
MLFVLAIPLLIRNGNTKNNIIMAGKEKRIGQTPRDQQRDAE